MITKNFVPLLAMFMASPVGAVTVDGVITNTGNGFFYDGFDNPGVLPAIVFEGDATASPLFSVEVLTNVLDEDGSLLDQFPYLEASGDMFTFSDDGVLVATLEVTFDPDELFAPFVEVTLPFPDTVDDVFTSEFDTFFAPVTVVSSDFQPAVIPLPATALLLATAFAGVVAVRARA